MGTRYYQATTKPAKMSSSFVKYTCVCFFFLAATFHSTEEQVAPDSFVNNVIPEEDPQEPVAPDSFVNNVIPEEDPQDVFMSTGQDPVNIVNPEVLNTPCHHSHSTQPHLPFLRLWPGLPC